MQSFTTSKLVTFSNGSIELVEEDDIFVQSLSYEMCSIFTDEAERRDRFHELAGKYFAGYSEINEEQMQSYVYKG